MLSTKERYALECRIIGTVLIENTYGQVASFLSVKNFRNWPQERINHQKVWQTIHSLYPTSFINLSTVPAQLRSHLPKGIDHSWYTYKLVGYTTTVHGSQMLQTDALHLVEDCIRTECLDLLARAPKGNLASQAAIQDIYDHLMNCEDVFHTISGAIPLCRDNDMPHLADSLAGIDHAISAKARKMREEAHLDAVYHHYQALRHVPLPDTEEAISCELFDILRRLFIGEKATEATAGHLEALSGSIGMDNEQLNNE